ncbi:IclR family transcriptional regulator [Anaerovorax sp. IOR16]|uniref:IclR family transcriptional regulator n=1 Tax=Anaerovorax sp. IOR16 TaxID=2773458 RepID=UPI0019D1E592|nr:IclR family transcriptional regulator [Anaerovorax sp. IOR16]
MNENKTSSIEKSLIILETLSSPPYEYKVQELVQKIGLNRSTIYRILCTLEEHALIVFDSHTSRYKIGPGMYHIGSTYLYNHNYHSKIQDILAEISDITKESVGMAIKDGNKIMSIFEIEVHQPMKLNDLPGKYFNVNKGCYGKCITAYQNMNYINQMIDNQSFEKTCPNTLTSKEELLKEYALIRKQGYVMSIDELGIDILGVGIPLFGREGNIKACVAVAFFREDGWEKKLDNFKDILLSYQNKLESNLP